MKRKRKIVIACSSVLLLLLACLSLVWSSQAQHVTATAFNQDTILNNGAPEGMNRPFGDGLINAGNSSAQANYGSNAPQVVSFNGSGLQYIQSSKADFDLTKDQSMSFWIYVGTKQGNDNDGMAFFLSKGAYDKGSMSGQGESLGVWGKPDQKNIWNTDSNLVANSALQNSWALEFDAYSNHDGDRSKLEKSTSAFDSDLDKKTHVAWNYPAQSSAYNIVQDFYGSVRMNHNDTEYKLAQGSWQHVTINYSAADSKLIYAYGDKDPATGLAQTASFTHSLTLNKSYLGSANSVYWGVTSYTSSSDPNLFILDTNSNYVSSSAKATIKDDGQDNDGRSYTVTDSGKTSNVYSGDKLTYTYDVSLKNAQTQIINGQLMTTLPSVFDTDKTLTAKVTYSDGTTEDAKVISAPTQATGTLGVKDLTGKNVIRLQKQLGSNMMGATVTIVGSAKQVDKQETVKAQTSYFQNGGLDASTSTPEYKLNPSVAATSTVKAQNMSTFDDEAITKFSDIVMTKSTVRYTYTLKYDKDNSIAAWKNVVADIQLPKQVRIMNSTEGTAQSFIHYGDGRPDKMLTADDVNAIEQGKGLAVGDLSATNPQVTITLDTFVNDQIYTVSDDGAVPATATTFTGDNLAQSVDNPRFTPETRNGAQSMRITLDKAAIVVGDTGNIKESAAATWNFPDESDDAIYVHGNVQKGGSPDNLDTVDFKVLVKQAGQDDSEAQVFTFTGKQSNTQTGKYLFKLYKADAAITDAQIQQEYKNSLASSTGTEWKSQVITLGARLGSGQTVVKIEAADHKTGDRASFDVGNGSWQDYATATINGGVLEMDTNSKNIQFNNVVLNGSSAYAATDTSSPFSLQVKNTVGGSWSLQAAMSKPFEDESGNVLSGALYYKNGSTSDEITSAATNVTNNSNFATSDDPAHVDITGGWKHDDLSALKDNGQGLYFAIKSDALQGTYTGQVTWTLSNAPQ